MDMFLTIITLVHSVTFLKDRGFMMRLFVVAHSRVVISFSRRYELQAFQDFYMIHKTVEM
jgi:hypothetical protein